jgi:hypothetical protein
MSRPKLNINRLKGGLGRGLLGEDHKSGFLAYQDVLPAGFGSSKYKIFYSTTEAETAGIIDSGTYDVEHYHISEYFRKNPKGELHVYLETVPADIPNRTYDEILDFARLAGGNIRQLGIFTVDTFNLADLTKIQAHVTTLRGEGKPLSVLHAGDFSAVSDLTTLSDLRALQNPSVSVVLAQSGAGVGKSLYTAKGYSITSLGNALGCTSAAAVHQNIGALELFPLSDGTEMSIGALANGDEILTLTPTLLDAIHAKGYIIPEVYPSDTQVYYTDSPTCVSETDDFAYIENNRTIDKAARQARFYVQPKLKSTLYVQADGTLDEVTLAVFEDLVDQALGEMEAAGEISAYETIIDPAQDVLATSALLIQVDIVPAGVARTITINLGFKPKLG